MLSPARALRQLSRLATRRGSRRTTRWTALLGALSLSVAAPVHAQATFENAPLDPFIEGVYSLTGPYQGWNWYGFNVARSAEYPFDPSGYRNLASGTASQYVAFANAFSSTGSTSSVYITPTSGTMDFLSLWVAAAWRSDMLLTITGYNAADDAIAVRVYLISPTPQLITPNITGVSKVGFSSTAGNLTPGYVDNGTAFAIDNVNMPAPKPPVVIVPEPSTVVLCAAGLAALALAARRRKTR